MQPSSVLPGLASALTNQTNNYHKSQESHTNVAQKIQYVTLDFKYLEISASHYMKLTDFCRQTFILTNNAQFPALHTQHKVLCKQYAHNACNARFYVRCTHATQGPKHASQEK